jgi:hypothetical protein
MGGRATSGANASYLKLRYTVFGIFLAPQIRVLLHHLPLLSHDGCLQTKITCVALSAYSTPGTLDALTASDIENAEHWLHCNHSSLCCHLLWTQP